VRQDWPSDLREQREALFLEVWIEGERFLHASAVHRDERHCVDQAEETLVPLDQEIEAGIMEHRVHPDNV
jgi:hypothetical protein